MTRGSHCHKTCRTICNCDQNNIKGSRHKFEVNQVIKRHYKGVIKQLRRVTFNFKNIYKAFLLKNQEIKTLSWMQSSDQDKFLVIK